MNQKLLIASNNSGKLEEITDLLKSLKIQVLIPKDIGLDLDVVESGASYIENARLKALAFCEASGLPSLADDTGLEVAALDGAPGLHSKRYTPDVHATDADRRKLLLANLADKPRPWKARFVCAVALAVPDGPLIDYQAHCDGEIVAVERGVRGFGYDHVFLFPELEKTMSELLLVEKNRISHRAKAVQGILSYLESL
ncbi:MAG: RdgB/HAM1 family non-canonical purine NTP pyrophosphatase [Chloroflexi bacterium]|nr:RdgB/HAM1 family non-canonical purine NTP pyrophosphatase [Chloroflexota bacterium]